MSDQVGSMRIGTVSIPAVFQGTARLLDGSGTPLAPRPQRFDDLEAAFQGAFDLDFAFLVGLGYRPVDPSHPAHALYLAASASPGSAASAPPIDAHGPDTVIVPFETVVTIPADRALRFGLVAPGQQASAPGAAGPAQPVRRRPAPPPVMTGPQNRPARSAPPAAIGDFAAFLAFIGDPRRNPAPADNAATPMRE